MPRARRFAPAGGIGSRRSGAAVRSRLGARTGPTGAFILQLGGCAQGYRSRIWSPATILPNNGTSTGGCRPPTSILLTSTAAWPDRGVSALSFTRLQQSRSCGAVWALLMVAVSGNTSGPPDAGGGGCHLAHWMGERTFPANDFRKVRQGTSAMGGRGLSSPTSCFPAEEPESAETIADKNGRCRCWETPIFVFQVLTPLNWLL